LADFQTHTFPQQGSVATETESMQVRYTQMSLTTTLQANGTSRLYVLPSVKQLRQQPPQQVGGWILYIGRPDASKSLKVGTQQ
jgi:hypothetical protein